MTNNNADIELLATLGINSSEPEIIRAMRILESRLRKNTNGKLKLEADIDIAETNIKATIDKLQNILKNKDLSVNTKTSIEAISKEANAMLEVVQAARKAANEKIEFANANKKVRESADDTADAITRERNAMNQLDDIDYIMNNITRSGQQGNSVFQQFGTTLRNAFYAYSAANLLQDAIYRVIDAGQESIEVVKELNDAATSLRMATGDSYESIKSLMNAYNELGQELGAITTDVSESADEWLRQGHSIEDTNTLIKDSMILSKVSNLESAESTEYLTSAMKGYKVAVENVLGIVDKLSAVDLESATDAGGLAEAMSRTSEGANLAGISMDRLLGMIATVGEVTQKSMSSIGESYKTIFSRMRDIKDNKLSVVGEDGEIEDLSNVEIVLDSLGIKLRESNQEFRNFQEVLDEVAGKWNNYSSVQQAAIAKAFSGVRQQENFLVMMENWDKVLEYTDIASNSSGTAEEKFGYYLESLEAKTNSLKASLENLATTTISDELYASVLDTSKAVVDLTADTGILKGLLVGLGAAGSAYVFQQLAHYLSDATQGFANLNEAMNMTRNGAVGIDDMQRLIDLTGGLSQSQTRLLLSTNNLTDDQKIAILVGQGMEQNLAEQQIQTWGVVSAQNGATAATVTWMGALEGLWATLMANPLILVTAAVTAGTVLFNKYKQAQEEAAQASSKLTQAWQEENSSIDESISKYQELQKKLQDTSLTTEEVTATKEELASIQDTLVDKYGQEALGIDLVNGKYDEQIAKLRELSKEKAKEYLAENASNVKKDRAYLNDEVSVTDYFGTGDYKNSGFDLDKYLKKYDKLEANFSSNGVEGAGDLYLTGTGTREELYNQLVALYNDVLNDFGSNPDDEVVSNFQSTLSSLISESFDTDAIDQAKANIKAYAEAEILGKDETRALYNEALDVVTAYNNALASGEGVEKAKANLDSVKEKIASATGNMSGADEVFQDVWDSVATGANNATAAVGNFNSATSSVANSRTSMISSLNGLSEGFEELDKIYASIKDDDPFDFKLLDDEAFKETFSGLGDVYADFIEQVTSTPDDIDACKSAFNDLVTEWINSTGVLDKVTDENAKLTQSMLEQMGVSNAEKVVEQALANSHARSAAQKIIDKNATIDLTNATAEEIGELLNEENVTDEVQMALINLVSAKHQCNVTGVVTDGDVKNLLALAQAANVASTEVANAKNSLAAIESGESYRPQAANNALYSDLYNRLQGQIKANYKNSYEPVKYNGGSTSNKGTSSSSSSAKQTAESINWIERAVKKVQRTIANLGKTVSATWKSWTTRNNALKDQISAINSELSIQQQAYDYYMKKANDVGLSKKYQDLVKNGTIRIDTIKDEKLVEQIKTFQEFYDQALECKDAIVDLQDELANLAITKFDNVAKEYENELSMIEHKANVIESSLDILESKGYMVSSQAYDALINIENEELNSLQNKYNSLTKALEEAMAVGKIQKMSDEWCDMQLEIYKVQEAILESENALVEYNNTLRDIEWEVFDKLQSKISSITSESDFLIELMSDEKMFDDNGITEHGQATLGLHALNYQTYLARTKEYASELAQIEEELAKDQYNQDLVDRKSELIKLQQDSILASESELDAIKSLKQEGYDALLDSMSKFIQKQKDMLSNISDMYNYQKNISEITANVSQYEKMLKSVQGMSDTESGKKLIQEYSVKLKEAQDNLEETEREKTISDIEQMLDALESNTEEWANGRLDNLDEIIKEAITQTETNTDSILKTLESETTKVGTTLTTEMESIWGSNGTFTTAMNNVVDMFKNYFDSLQKASDTEASKTITSATSGGSSSGSSSSSSSSANTTSNVSTNNSSSYSGWGSWFVSKTYAKQNLHPETSIVDRLKSKNINADFSYRSQYYRAMGGSNVYTGSASQNNWMLSQMKSHGFAKGGTIGELIRATGEDGFVLARKGEGILTPENMKMLENVMVTMNPIVDSLAKLPSLPDVRKQNGDMQVNFEGGIQMYGVNDPVEFENQLLHHMKNSRPVRMVMKDTTIGEALGKNPMIRYTR